MKEVLWNLWLAPLTEQSFQKALIGGSLVAVVCGVMGCFVILRRMAFLGDALSHAMLAGVTAGYLFMQIFFGVEAHAPAMLVGSIIAGLVTVGLVGFVSKVSRIKEDTAIGIMYTGIFALGGILASIFSHRIHLDLYHFVTGMVLGVEDGDLWMMAWIAALVLAIVILFYRHLQITTFDPVMAASLGFPVMAINYLLTTCTSLVVVGAVNIVGVILVVGLLVTPAATAYLLSDRLSRMLPLAAGFGVAGVLGGLYLSMWIGNIATGPSIILVTTLQFLIILAVAPRYGLIAQWWRRRTMVPQQIIEDILGCFRYAEGNTISLSDLQRSVSARPTQLRNAVRSLQKQDLLEGSDTELRLTSAGRKQAELLLRAHRLWETYLKQVGTPTNQLHERAHELEHLHDAGTVDYLDDKLGHPLKDPHGAVIPEDQRLRRPDAVVRASLLRQGRTATVIDLEEPARRCGLTVGMQITAGSRSDEGRRWNFLLSNGQTLQLDHPTADAVTVRVHPRESESAQAQPPHPAD